MKRLILIAMVFLMSSSIVLAQNFCQGDFNYNGNVAAEDVEIFLEHFGRSIFSNPCPPDGPAPVQKTGQDNSYGVPGSDGDLLRGLEWPVPRFTDNENGTIKDNLTGLIWLKDANCFGVRNWLEAITECHNLGDPACDLTDGSNVGDWRLPNRFELESLLDMKFYEPALSNRVGNGQWEYGDPFINLVTDHYYWTSTTYPRYTDSAWFVYMYSGSVGSYLKIYSYHVWPVRGGR